MTKRIVSMILAILLIASFAFALADTYYVKTNSGINLNYRSEPKVEPSNVLGSFKYGTELKNVIPMTNGWSQVTLSDGRIVYVFTRYLSKTNPGEYVNPDKDTSTEEDVAAALAAMNAQFKSAKKVKTPYTIMVNPGRVTGWVYLRWAPSTSAQQIATLPYGKELTVLAELTNWYQVQDKTTGAIGFISRRYTSVK